MTASSQLCYTDPPQRLLDELADGSRAQQKVAAAEQLVAELPDTAAVVANHDGQQEHLGQTTVVHRFVAAPGDSETVLWHFVEAGDSTAPTVVFLHGVPDSWWQWHYALDALSGQYHCIAIDLKGYGQSDKRTGDYRQRGVAGQLRALLDQIGVGRFALVSHDRGTPPADHLAGMVGERLIGYARGQQHLWHLHPSLHPQEQLFVSPQAPSLLGDPRRFVATAYSLLTERPVATTDLVRTIVEFSHPGIATAVPRYFHSSSFRQEWIDRRTELIPSWRAPVQLLQGSNDPMQPREFYSDPHVSALLPPGSGLHLFDTGHFWPFEAPEETVATIKAFLDRVTRAEPAHG
ncbi:MAG: alpha/beta hydrolase [Mycobacteriaceae bacterium]|nr:alpha/beta hydrolase [Mycobacteriaceae bacterium]MBV9641906.1 alpha/beta hydrolase [Mycobacteriaceae bacterium]